MCMHTDPHFFPVPRSRGGKCLVAAWCSQVLPSLSEQRGFIKTLKTLKNTFEEDVEGDDKLEELLPGARVGARRF